MATNHLTNDNGVSAFSAQSNHLGGVTTSGGSHLVTIKQVNAWTNKEFVVTPTEFRYNKGWCLGREQYPTAQGGTYVYNDTNTLLNNVKNSLNTNGWKTGQCALFSIFCRSSGPYAWYDYVNHYSSSMPTPEQLSEFGMSVVAYKFNLHRLHLSKMVNQFSAYVRVWAPSYVIGNPLFSMDPSDGVLIPSSLYNDASKLRVKFFTDLPTLSWDVADTGDSFEFYGAANNGQTVSQDTFLDNRMAIYNPFDGKVAFTGFGNTSKIYTLQYPVFNTSLAPTNFYHDFQVSNTNNLNLLKNNPAEFWVVAHFHCGNAFSQGTNTGNGLAQSLSATVFAERIELVLKCTSAKFNS